MCYFHKHLNLNYSLPSACNIQHLKVFVAFITSPTNNGFSLFPPRADVLTSPEFNLSRGGEEDTRRKYSHIATFQPSRENWALPCVSWMKPQLRRFLHSPLPGASIAVPSPYVSPPYTPALWLATVTSSIDLHASAFVEYKGRIQTTKDNNVFLLFLFF